MELPSKNMKKPRKFPLELILALAVNAILALCLFQMNVGNIHGPAEQQEVKVSITDFKPPQARTLPKIQMKELQEKEQKVQDEQQQSEKEFAEENVKETDKMLSQAEPAEEPTKVEAELPTGTTETPGMDNAELMQAMVPANGEVKISTGEATGVLYTPAGHRRGESLLGRQTAAKRHKLTRSHGGDDQTEQALARALKFLVSKQNEDGSWGGDDSRKSGDSAALSSLALLALLGNGEHPNSRNYGKNVGRAIDYLVKLSYVPNIEQIGDGFGHAILTYALAEAYAVTGDIRLHQALQARVAAVIARQNKYGSFNVRYNNSPQSAPPSTDAKNPPQIILGEPACNLSLLGWHIQALTAAKVAGIDVEGLDKALQLANEALVVIHQADKGGFSQGINMKHFPSDENLTPVGLLGLHLLGNGRSTPARKALEAMTEDKKHLVLPDWGNSGKFPLYRWYYQTQAVFQHEDGRGAKWKSWNDNLKANLLKNQSQDGSWNRPAGEAGFKLKDNSDLTIYSSSMCALMLEIYYRYLPAYSIAEAPVRNKSPADELDAGKQGLISRLPGGIDPLAAKVLGIGTSQIKSVEFGVFNGMPDSVQAPHYKDEFKVYGSLGSTISVAKTDEFPQTLQPNQRIALILDKFMPESFKGHLLLTLAVCNEQSKMKDYCSMEAVVNGKRVYNSMFITDKQIITLLLPGSVLKSFGNILELRNNGNGILAFDAARLSSAEELGNSVFLGAEDLDKLPENLRSIFNVGVIAVDVEAETEIEALPRRIATLRKFPVEPMISIKNLNDGKRTLALAAQYADRVKFWELTGVQAPKVAVTMRKEYPDLQVMVRGMSGDNQTNCFSLSSYEEYRSLMQRLNVGKYDPTTGGWGTWACYGTLYMGNEFQQHYVCREGRSIVEWLAGGGNGVYLSAIMQGQMFYDPVFGGELPPLEALKRLGKLFDGMPRQIPSSLYPLYGEEPLFASSATAVCNTSGVATVAVARRFPIAQELEVTALVPWNGKTQLIVEEGIFPPDGKQLSMATPLKTTVKEIEIANNTFKYAGMFPELMTIRLVKKGEKNLVRTTGKISKSVPGMDTELNAVKVNQKPESGLVRKSVRKPNDFSTVLGASGSVQIVPATPAQDRGTPMRLDSESVVASFALDNGVAYDSVFLKCNVLSEAAEGFTFWTLPHATDRAKGVHPSSIPLRFAVGGKCFMVNLQPDQWQQITVPLSKENNWSYDTLRIVKPQLIHQDFTDISYEVNKVSIYHKTQVQK